MEFDGLLDDVSTAMQKFLRNRVSQLLHANAGFSHKTAQEMAKEELARVYSNAAFVAFDVISSDPATRSY